MRKNRQAKRQALEVIRYVESLRDEEGRACIDVMLREDTELYDPLSVGENLDLNGEIYEFIDTQANIVSSHIPLRIRFRGRNVSPQEQETIRQIMRRHYTICSYDVVWDMAANLRKMLCFALFGAAVLAIYLSLVFTNHRPLSAEILSIIGSFSLWEAADALLIERPRLRREYANIMQNIHQTVEFTEE